MSAWSHDFALLGVARQHVVFLRVAQRPENAEMKLAPALMQQRSRTRPLA
jgi:hypothetical protein